MHEPADDNGKQEAIVPHPSHSPWEAAEPLGFVWCGLFERHPNVFTLTLSHAWRAFLLRAAWPEGWLRGMRVGPGLWAWTL